VRLLKVRLVEKIALIQNIQKAFLSLGDLPNLRWSTLAKPDK
jgi:hypothetical protein